MGFLIKFYGHLYWRGQAAHSVLMKYNYTGLRQNKIVQFAKIETVSNLQLENSE